MPPSSPQPLTPAQQRAATIRKSILLICVVIFILAVVTALVVSLNQSTPATTNVVPPAATSTPTVVVSESPLKTRLIAHAWTATLPNADGRVTTIFLPARYLVLSDANELIDQGYLSVDEATRTFSLHNSDGVLAFQVPSITAPTLVATTTLDFRFVSQILEDSVTFTPVATPVALPVPTTIQDAASWGDIAAVDRFLASGESVNIQDAAGVTPLIYAAQYFHPDMVAHLLQRGADASLQTNKQQNALHAAAQVGNEQAIRLLLAKGLDVNLKTGSGSTPLYLAVSKNSLPAVRILVEARADINTTNQDGTTPLINAVSVASGSDAGSTIDNVPMLTYLLDHGADINAKDRLGQSALSQAISFGLLPTVKLLLVRGADATIKVRDLTMREYLRDPINGLSPEVIQAIDLVLPKTPS